MKFVSFNLGFLISAFPVIMNAGTIDFARDVQPILSDNCYACHGPDEEERAADLRLDAEVDAKAVFTPGAPDKSELIARITTSDPDDLMPPPEKKDRLSTEQVKILKQWIEEGAEWGKHWAFEAPKKPRIPEGKKVQPVDAFVEKKLSEEGLAFSPEASKAKQLRRLALDLTGLPPTVEELDAFLNDDSQKAYEKAVDRFLDSPHYGERWARWWMDAARYADSNGYEKDSVRHVWPYRDWLISSFNDNLPYDQFIVKQMAGDLLENASLSDHVATGFLRNSMVNEEGAIKAEQFRIEGIFDRMDALGKSVLGLTMQCAQCHTHKYDPITQKEYYGMFAYLNNSYEATVPYYTPEERKKIESIRENISHVRAEVRNSETDWKADLQNWIETQRAAIANQPDWTTVTPKHLGDGGQKFYPQPDGSIITKGYSPAQSTERFLGESPVEKISSLRLELLMDPYLTYGGPGRSISGTVAISEIKLSAGTDPDKLTNVALEPATCDFEQPARPIDTTRYPLKGDKPDDRTEGPAAFATDGNVKTAWSSDAGWGQSNQPRVLVINLKEPLLAEKGKPLYLQFEVQCRHGGWNSNDNQHRNMGRFRFSLGGGRFENEAPVSPLISAILAKEQDKWTEEEKTRVFDEWVSKGEGLSKWSEVIEKQWAQHPAPTPQLTLLERSDRRETRLFDRGEQTHPKEAVEPHVPAAFHPLPEGENPTSRLTFAHWLVDRDSPTTARTYVNRTWMAFFGRGIVESVEDLGHQATPPTHPDLLDWLAVEFMDSGWDIKALHRLIVTSQTYRQDSRVRDSLGEIDPMNRLLARGPRFRPDAELVRDIQLAASGLLDRTVGGDSVRPPIPRFLFDPPASYGYKEWDEDEDPERRYRRAMYTFRFRTVPPPFLSAFDAPSGEISCVRRPRSTTPLQALALLNEPLSVEAAKALAETIREGGEEELKDSISQAFRQCTSREPVESEVAILIKLFDSEKSNGGDPWLAVARTLLNLDETITKS